MKAKLIIISAPSGAGKTTLCQRLLNDFSNLELSISTTSRLPRGQEIHGREYFFVTREEFQNQIALHRFAEWAEVHGNFYGTSKDSIDRALQIGHSVLLDIDVQGAASLRSTYPELAYGIFISPPNLSVLEQRLRARGTESEESIQKRLKNAALEIAAASQFHRTIVNDDLERAYLELRQAVQVQIGESP